MSTKIFKPFPLLAIPLVVSSACKDNTINFAGDTNNNSESVSNTNMGGSDGGGGSAAGGNGPGGGANSSGQSSGGTGSGGVSGTGGGDVVEPATCEDVTCESPTSCEMFGSTPRCVCDGGFHGENCDQCVVYVDRKSSCKDGCGESWKTAYSHLQAGIDRAAERTNCEVWVAQGTYLPSDISGVSTRQSTFTTKAGVSLYGGFDGDEIERTERDWVANETILSGDIDEDGILNDGNVYHIVTNAHDSVFDGFTVKLGNAAGAGDHAQGSGMISSNGLLEVTNCVFTENSESAIGIVSGLSTIKNTQIISNPGIGIWHDWGALSAIIGCEVSHNLNGGVSGGIFGLPLLISESEFAENSGAAAISVGQGSLEIETSKFVSNTAGAVAVGLSRVTVASSEFRRNSSSDGPAISLDHNSSLTATSTLFIENQASRDGGAVAFLSSGSHTLSNVLFVGNRADRYGGAVHLKGRVDVTCDHCVFAANRAGGSGGAIHNSLAPDDGELTIRNSVIWNNWSWDARTNSIAGTSTVSHSVVDGGHAGVGNLNEDPLFVAAPSLAGDVLDPTWNVRLQSSSPCVDTGDDGVGLASDFDGNARIDVSGVGQAGTQADIGAYEYVP